MPLSQSSVDAGFFEYAHDGHALLKTAPELLIVLPGQHALIEAGSLARHAVTHEHGVIRAADALDALYHLRGDAQTVFKATAVLICTVVEVGHGKLVKEIALVDGVYLDTVAARFLGEGGAVYHHIDELVYLVLSERAVLHLGREHIGHAVARGDHGALIVEVGQRHAEVGAQTAPHTGTELEHKLCVRLLVYLRHELLERTAEHVTCLVQPAGTAPFVRQDGESRNYHADAALCGVHEELDAVGVELVIDDGRGTAHCAKDDPVGHFELVYLERLEQRIILVVDVILHILFSFARKIFYAYISNKILAQHAF